MRTFYLRICLFTFQNWSKMTVFYSTIDFLSTNSGLGVQNDGTYLPRITRETCLIFLTLRSNASRAPKPSQFLVARGGRRGGGLCLVTLAIAFNHPARGSNCFRISVKTRLREYRVPRELGFGRIE